MCRKVSFLPSPLLKGIFFAKFSRFSISSRSFLLGSSFFSQEYLVPFSVFAAPNFPEKEKVGNW